MAMHPLVIGRLVGLISDELDDLYDYKARHEERYRHLFFQVSHKLTK
jgi:hypothetical protein